MRQKVRLNKLIAEKHPYIEENVGYEEAERNHEMVEVLQLVSLYDGPYQHAAVIKGLESPVQAKIGHAEEANSHEDGDESHERRNDGLAAIYHGAWYHVEFLRILEIFQKT